MNDGKWIWSWPRPPEEERPQRCIRCGVALEERPTPTSTVWFPTLAAINSDVSDTCMKCRVLERRQEGKE